MACISLCILPVVGNPVHGVTTVTGPGFTNQVATTTMFDGTYYRIKNADTGALMKTITVKEFEMSRPALESKYRISGPDSSGLVTFFDPVKSIVVRPDVSEMIAGFQKGPDSYMRSGSVGAVTISGSAYNRPITTGYLSTIN